MILSKLKNLENRPWLNLYAILIQTLATFCLSHHGSLLGCFGSAHQIPCNPEVLFGGNLSSLVRLKFMKFIAIIFCYWYIYIRKIDFQKNLTLENIDGFLWGEWWAKPPQWYYCGGKNSDLRSFAPHNNFLYRPHNNFSLDFSLVLKWPRQRLFVIIKLTQYQLYAMTYHNLMKITHKSPYEITNAEWKFFGLHSRTMLHSEILNWA